MFESEAREYRPELIPRRGEANAWLFAVAALIGLFLLSQTVDSVPGWVWVSCGFLAFSALTISFGNWMDRNTRITLETGGIRFENGLRRVQFHWQEIQKVAVLPAQLGKSVRVVGEASHFGFKTLGEVQFRGKVRGRTGFAEGEAILDVILQNTGLVLTEESNNAYYYARG